jgi:short subunit dehydrogenase-like uncharacterized protein
MSDLSRCLVYGAYGYTGELIARTAAERGLRPILAGRSRERVEALAKAHGMPSRAFSLDDARGLDAGLEGVDVVIHAAGPFSRTSRPMVDACLRTRTHYLDITGEIDVFEACAARDAEAARAGVMLMPGTGFDVVPSDCLALHLKQRLPDATHLRLAFTSVGGGSSRGTATTAIEGLGKPNLVRKEGVLTPVRLGERSCRVDFGRGPRPTLGIPWGDVSTAWSSTRIPNIEVYMGVPGAAVVGAKVVGLLGGAIAGGRIAKTVQRRIDRGPAGPTDAQRSASISLLVGEAQSGSSVVSSRLRCPEGYTLTALSSLEIARRVLEKDFEPGYRTPATRYGADFILTFPGTERTDLERSPFSR